jgi:hypothetical protein
VLLFYFANLVLPIFANVRLLLVHLFAALPISYLLVSRSADFINRFRFSTVVLLVVTLSVPVVIPFSSEVLNSLGAGYAVRWIFRSCVTICFSYAWCAPVAMTVRWDAENHWIWAVIIWLALPCVYGLKQYELASNDFVATSSSMRLVKASNALKRLIEISGHATVQGKSTIAWDRNLRRQIKETESIAARTLPEGSPLSDRLQLAMSLLSLSRTTEAVSLLDELNSTDPQVQLLGAIAAREGRDWRRVESLCGSIIVAQSTTDGENDPTAYQLLGESLIHGNRVKDALHCFQEAIEACPQASGDFEMRIGLLLGESGDHAGAIEHFKRAQKVDPKLSVEGSRRIAAMRNNSCQLSPP